MRFLSILPLVTLTLHHVVQTHADTTTRWDPYCDACTYGLFAIGASLQSMMIASGEAAAESGIILSTAGTLEAEAKLEGKTLREVAEKNAEFMKAVTTFASLIANVFKDDKPIPFAPLECVIEVFMENIAILLFSGGQAIVPIVFEQIGEWSCCNKECTPYKPNEKPKPPPPVPPTPQPSSEQKVVRLDDAMNAGKEAAIRASKSQNLRDIDLWREAQAAVMELGDFCTKNIENNAPVPAVAENDAEKNEQNLARIDSNACACQYYCWTWQFSSTPFFVSKIKDVIVPDVSCFNTISYGEAKGSDSTCPGAWWRHIPGPDVIPYIYGIEQDIAHSAGIDPNGLVQVGPPPPPPDLRKFWMRDVQIIISFGARTENYNIAGGPDIDKDIGFKRVGVLKKELSRMFEPSYHQSPKKNFVYLDRDALQDLPGSYFDKENSKIMLNEYWAEYYQSAMDSSKLMIFLIDSAWLSSPNCWEELAWASDMQLNPENRNHDPPQIAFEERPFREYIPSTPVGELKQKYIFAYLGKDIYDNYRTPTDGQIILLGGDKISAATPLPQAAVEVICPKLSLEEYLKEKGFKSGLSCIFEKITELVQNHELIFS